MFKIEFFLFCLHLPNKQNTVEEVWVRQSVPCTVNTMVRYISYTYVVGEIQVTKIHHQLVFAGLDKSRTIS